MRADSFSDALGQLDPASRALLDLSLRRGMRTDEIAEILGAEPESVATSRDEALRRVADDLGMGGEQEIDHVRALLAELPAEDWLGGPVATNGHANGHGNGNGAPATADEAGAKAPAGVAERAALAQRLAGEEPVEPVEEPAADGDEPAEQKRSEPRPRRRMLPLLLALLALAAAAALVVALTGGESDEPKAEPAQRPAPEPEPRPAPRPEPAARLTPIAGGEARGSARLTGGGDRLAIKLRDLPAPGRSSYAVWLYDSIIESRRLGAARAVRIDLDARLPANWRSYRWVDVSREPADGNASHSGESVARVATKKLR